MAKTTAPLLSFGASGQVGKAAVFAKWRGVSYARQHVVPANPNSSEQQLTRGVFKYATDLWKAATPYFITIWDLFAKGRPFTGRNAMTGKNIEALRDQPNNDDMIWSPGANGPLGPPSISLTPASGAIHVDFTNPTVPSDWSVSGIIAQCVKKQDPMIAFAGLMHEATDFSAPFSSVTLTGLTSLQTQQVAGICQYLKPDGSTAYSTAATAKAVPS